MNHIKYKLDSWIGNLSKTFLKAMREVDGQDTKYHLHCLRHTFAVRRYLQTRDIYLVKNELGHESVTTTEIYAKFSLRRLENDFPSLMNIHQIREFTDLGHEFTGHINPIISPSINSSGLLSHWLKVRVLPGVHDEKTTISHRNPRQMSGFSVSILFIFNHYLSNNGTHPIGVRDFTCLL